MTTPTTNTTAQLFCVDFSLIARKQTLRRTGKRNPIRENIALVWDKDNSDRIPANGYQTPARWNPVRGNDYSYDGYADWDLDGSLGDHDWRMRQLAENLIAAASDKLAKEQPGCKIVLDKNDTRIFRTLFDLCKQAYIEQEATGDKYHIHDLPYDETSLPDTGMSPQRWDVVDCGLGTEYFIRIGLEKVSDAYGQYVISFVTYKQGEQIRVWKSAACLGNRVG